MRLLFAGTPEFAAAALVALIEAGHDIPLVLTQPDRPAGRGQKLAQSEVKQLALRHGIELLQPASLKDDQTRNVLTRQGAQVMVVAAYGLILPASVLELFPQGCINIHASLLPRWRGAAPIQRAILAGDKESGICIMRMDEGLDTGPVMLRERVPIVCDETGGSLHGKLSDLGSKLIVQAIAQLETGTAYFQLQPSEGVSYARKILKEEARIQWQTSVHQIDAQIRAFNPVPVCFTNLGTVLLRLWRAQVRSADSVLGVPPGQILATSPEGIDIACGHGVLRVTEVQKAGGNRQSAADFLRGQPLQPGAIVGP